MTATGFHSECIKIFVHKAVRPVCLRLFTKRYNELKPDDCEPGTWTLDQFLQVNKQTILSHRDGRSWEWILFPTGNTKANIERWDSSLMCFLLIEVCKLGSKVLTSNLKMLTEYLHKIEKFENDSFDQYKYENYLIELKSIISFCLSEIKDPELTRKIDEVYNNLERENLTKKENFKQTNKKQIVVMKSVGNQNSDAGIIK